MTSNNNAMIELKNIEQSFRLESGLTIKVLEGVNLSIGDNEFVALLGPSGSGKSTCLRLMCGLLSPKSGTVLSNGVPLHGINSNVSMVFQSFALFPWETVVENIALALTPLQLSKQVMKERIRQYIDIVGLEGFEEAYPRELSGGMKQRVGLARALAMERPILFLDEPFSAVDVLTADTLRNEVVNIFQERKTATRSIVMVSHNITEAVFMAKRILIMGRAPGGVRWDFPVDLPYPRDENSPAFKRIVSKIHDLITEAFIPDTALSGSKVVSVAAETSLEALPRVQMGEMIGLMESIEERGGKADVFELAQAVHKDFGSTLFLVKALEFLDLVETPKQMVHLTDLGQRFIKGNINVKKGMLHELFGQLNLVKKITALLQQMPKLKMPIQDLQEELATWPLHENPHDLLETLISWGRFAEYFGYNDDTKEVYLDVGQEAHFA